MGSALGDEVGLSDDVDVGLIVGSALGDEVGFADVICLVGTVEGVNVGSVLGSSLESFDDIIDGLLLGRRMLSKDGA